MADINRLVDKELEEIDIIDEKLQVETKTSDEKLQSIYDNAVLIYNLINNAKDPLNTSIGSIEVDHKEIHEGNHYFYANYIAFGSTATNNFVLEVGEKAVHYTFGILSDSAGFSFVTYEDVSADEDETVITPLNNNRVSINTSSTVLRLNPANVSTEGATLLRNGVLGTAGGTSQRTAGNVGRESELILKPNTKYLLRIINLASATNNISTNMSWYELD